MSFLFYKEVLRDAKRYTTCSGAQKCVSLHSELPQCFYYGVQNKTKTFKTYANTNDLGVLLSFYAPRCHNFNEITLKPKWT